MSVVKSKVTKVVQTAFLLLIWYGIGSAAFSLSIGKIVNGLIKLAIVGLIVFILIDRRLLRKLQERPMPGKFLLGIYVVVFIIIQGVIRDWRLFDIYVLGRLHIPGVIIYARSVGLIILTAILLWETISLTHHHFTSRG